MLNFKQIAISLEENEVKIEATSVAKVNDAVIAIAGEAWGGILTINSMLYQIAARLGIQVRAFPTFPAEIRGGPCNVVARISESTPTSHGYAYDVLVAFTQRDLNNFYPSLKSDGVLIHDETDMVTNQPIFVSPRAEQAHYAVPFLSLARSINENWPNIVAFGVLTSFFGIPLEMSEQLIRDEFSRKSSFLVERNLKALRAGFEYAQTKLRKIGSYQIEASGVEPYLLVPGNEAATLGLIAAGLERFFGYPITPSSEGFQACIDWLLKLGGRAVQMENEDASILAIIGSFFAGKKAATFTSGPGLSRMQESLSLAYMLEVPVVVVNSMRGGPSTGLPTKTEQSDLLSAIFGPHGDATNVVLAATSVEDAFYKAITVMNLAVKYQTPVILLLDQALSLGYQTMPPPDLSKIQVEQLRRPTSEQLKAYERYRRDPDLIAPLALPGDKGGRYRTTGLEHDQRGNPSSDPAVHAEMSELRKKKIESIVNDPMVSSLGLRFGAEHPKIAVIGWGTTEGPMREAVNKAQAEGISVAGYISGLMWPFDPRVAHFVAGAEKIIVVEQNQGQYDLIVKSKTLRPTILVSELTGLPVRPQTIYDAIREVNQ